MSNPGPLPITRGEMAGSETKRRLADVRASQVDRWAKTLLDQRRDGAARPAGSWHGVGQLSPGVQAALERRGVPIASSEISMTDRALLHAARPSKVRRGQGLPDRELRRIADHLEAPMAVLWDLKNDHPTLHYVFHVPGETKLGRATVGLRRGQPGGQPRILNRVLTVSLVDRSVVTDTKTYDLLEGKL